MSRWILQVSAGVGPWEVRRFVAALARALEARLSDLGLQVESVTVHGELEAPASIELALVGDAERALQGWLGTHALVARSPRRERASRKRWYAGVRLYPAPSVPALQVDPTEVDFQAMRAGGPGGQHVNTTSSAVRAVHRPTGISVRVSNERSQHANRRIALERLSEALAERAGAAQAREQGARRQAHYELERGNPVRVWVPDERDPEALKEEEP